MKKIITLLSMVAVISTASVLAQEEKKLSIEGFIRPDLVVDSRKNAEALDGLVSLYPLGKELDANGKDINGEPSVAMSSITTRFIANYNGPQVGSALLKGFVEFDFTATSNSNSVRFRQGYISFNWANDQILVGRTWHPLAAYCTSNVMGINYGAPFYLFNRSDQFKYTHNFGKLSLAAAFLYQGDYASLGPLGKSISYHRNSMVPDMNLILQWKDENVTLGGVLNYKAIRPRQTVIGSYGAETITDERIGALSAQVFGIFKHNNFTLKASETFAQNLTESLTLGGYAIASYDPLTGHETYSPTRHSTSWINADVNSGNMVIGLFAGYMKNLGTAQKSGMGTLWARGGDIASLYRVSPHLYYNVKNLQLGCEVELTGAQYGEPDPNDRLLPKNTYSVTNMRFNVMALYKF